MRIAEGIFLLVSLAHLLSFSDSTISVIHKRTKKVELPVPDVCLQLAGKNRHLTNKVYFVNADPPDGCSRISRPPTLDTTYSVSGKTNDWTFAGYKSLIVRQGQKFGSLVAMEVEEDWTNQYFINVSFVGYKDGQALVNYAYPQTKYFFKFEPNEYVKREERKPKPNKQDSHRQQNSYNYRRGPNSKSEDYGFIGSHLPWLPIIPIVVLPFYWLYRTYANYRDWSKRNPHKPRRTVKRVCVELVKWIVKAIIRTTNVKNPRYRKLPTTAILSGGQIVPATHDMPMLVSPRPGPPLTSNRAVTALVQKFGPTNDKDENWKWDKPFKMVYVLGERVGEGGSRNAFNIKLCQLPNELKNVDWVLKLWRDGVLEGELQHEFMARFVQQNVLRTASDGWTSHSSRDLTLDITRRE